MSLLMETPREVSSGIEPEENALSPVARDLIDMDAFLRDFFEKRWDEARQQRRPVMAFGIHETVDGQGKKLLFARTPNLENIITINPGDPSYAWEFRWSALDPAGSATDYTEAELRKLKETVEALRVEQYLQTIGRIMVAARKRSF